MQNDSGLMAKEQKKPTFLDSAKMKISDNNSRLCTLICRLEALGDKAQHSPVPDSANKNEEATSSGLVADIESLVKQGDKYLDRLCLIIEKLENII